MSASSIPCSDNSWSNSSRVPESWSRLTKRALRSTMSFRRDPQRVAAFHHQSHLARHEVDHAVLARIEPLPAGSNILRAQFAARQVHAGEIAGALRQRNQRILVADIAQIDADAGLAIQQLAQLRDRKTMAGV